jgi:hypothetical protein
MWYYVVLLGIMWYYVVLCGIIEYYWVLLGIIGGIMEGFYGIKGD